MKKTKIFFQGDSITDCNRDRSDNHNLAGFSLKVANLLGDDYEYVNYGISGDTTRYVLSRHEKEFIKEKADIMVMMIGVNDVWRYFDGISHDAVDEIECVSNIKKIIEITRKINPYVQIIFLEPYLIIGYIPCLNNAKETFDAHLNMIQKEIPQLVDRYIPFAEDFLNRANNGELLADDGVHPNDKGQEVIADRIATAIKEII